MLTDLVVRENGAVAHMTGVHEGAFDVVHGIAADVLAALVALGPQAGDEGPPVALELFDHGPKLFVPTVRQAFHAQQHLACDGPSAPAVPGAAELVQQLAALNDGRLFAQAAFDRLGEVRVVAKGRPTFADGFDTGAQQLMQDIQIIGEQMK